MLATFRSPYPMVALWKEAGAKGMAMASPCTHLGATRGGHRCRMVPKGSARVQRWLRGQGAALIEGADILPRRRPAVKSAQSMSSHCSTVSSQAIFTVLNDGAWCLRTQCRDEEGRREAGRGSAG